MSGQWAFNCLATTGEIYVQSQRAGERVLASITRFLERTPRLMVNHSLHDRYQALAVG